MNSYLSLSYEFICYLTFVQNMNSYLSLSYEFILFILDRDYYGIIRNWWFNFWYCHCSGGCLKSTIWIHMIEIHMNSYFGWILGNKWIHMIESRCASAAAVAFVSIVIIVAVFVAVAVDAFSWLLIVVCAPALTVTAGVFIATAAARGGKTAAAAAMPNVVALPTRCPPLPPPPRRCLTCRGRCRRPTPRGRAGAASSPGPGCNQEEAAQERGRRQPHCCRPCSSYACCRPPGGSPAPGGGSGGGGASAPSSPPPPSDPYLHCGWPILAAVLHCIPPCQPLSRLYVEGVDEGLRWHGIIVFGRCHHDFGEVGVYFVILYRSF